MSELKLFHNTRALQLFVVVFEIIDVDAPLACTYFMQTTHRTKVAVFSCFSSQLVDCPSVRKRCKVVYDAVCYIKAYMIATMRS